MNDSLHLLKPISLLLNFRNDPCCDFFGDSQKYTKRELMMKVFKYDNGNCYRRFNEFLREGFIKEEDSMFYIDIDEIERFVQEPQVKRIMEISKRLEYLQGIH